MSLSYYDLAYFAILAMRGEEVQPLSLWACNSLVEVMREVRRYWPGASIIYVVWHTFGKRSQLTDENC